MRTHLTRQEELVDEYGIQQVALDPSSPVVDQIWYNSTQNVIKTYDGTQIKVIGPAVSQTPLYMPTGDSSSALDESLLKTGVIGEGDIPNQLVESFEDNNFGTITGGQASSYAMRFSTGSNSMSYERTRTTPEVVDSVIGVANISLHSVAPVSVSAQVSAGAFAVSGNFAAMFPTTKPIYIYKVILTDLDSSGNGIRQCIPILTSRSVPAFFNVTASSYSSATNTTTITISNPENLDVSMGGIDVGTLRLSPFDFVIQASATGSGNYETCEVSMIQNMPNVAIPGELFMNLLSQPKGSIQHFDAKMSPNGVYGIIRIVENTAAANSLWHWYYTINGGLSWTKFTRTRYLGTNWSYTGSAYYLMHANQIAVADNGRFAFCYVIYNPQYDLYAAWGDLSLPAPELNDLNRDQTTSGAILGNASYSTCGAITADTKDMSYFVIRATRGNSDSYFSAYRWQLNTDRPQFDKFVNPTGSETWSYPNVFELVGSGTEHRLHKLYRHSSNGYTYGWYFDQVGINQAWSYNAGSNITESTDSYYYDHKANSKWLVNVIRWSNDVYKLHKLPLSSVDMKQNTGYDPVSQNFETPAPYICYSGTGNAFDAYQGTNSSWIENGWRTMRNRIMFNPLNDNHMLLLLNQLGADGARRCYLHEYQDITQFQGPVVYSYNTASSVAFFNGTRKEIAQIFEFSPGNNPPSAPVQRVRSIGLRMWQNGTLPQGYRLWVEVWSVNNGIPTAPISGLYRSHDVNPANISKSNEWVWFAFPATLTLDYSTKYAFIVRSDIPVDGTNNLGCYISTANQLGATFYLEAQAPTQIQIDYQGSNTGSASVTGSTQRLGQVFTAPTSDVFMNSLNIKMWRTAATTGTVYMDIYAVSGTLPTGSPIATSSNGFDISTLSTSAYTAITFNFNNIKLSAGQTYAWVIRSLNGAAITSVNISLDAPSTFTGGARISSTDGGVTFTSTANTAHAFTLNGVRSDVPTTWVSQAAQDLCFEINAEWIQEISEAQQSSVSPTGQHKNAGDSQMALLDNYTVRYYERLNHSWDDNHRLMTGVTRHKDITFQSNGTKSIVSPYRPTFTDVNSYDPFVVFNVALGHPECATYNNVGQFSSTVQAWQDASEFFNPYSASNSIGATSFVTDPTFSTGYGCDFNGTNAYLQYTSRSWYNVFYHDMIVEAEIKPTAAVTANNQTIVAKWAAAIANQVFDFRIATDGKLEFILTNGTTAYSTKASDINEPTTVHRVRAVKSGRGTGLCTVRLYRDTGSGWTEVASYSSQVLNNPAAQIQPNGTSDFSIGQNVYVGNATSFGGRIGYVKFGVGTNSFVYDGWKSQRPVCIGQVLNNKYWIAQYKYAPNADLANCYNRVVMLQQPSAGAVDSYQHLVFFGRKLASSGTSLAGKITLSRGSAANLSAIHGLNMRFVKGVNQ